MLWTAAWTLRNRCAEPADLKRCIFRSRRRTTWCEFSARLFIRSPLLMTAGQAKGLERSGIGAQLVGDRQLGRKALLLKNGRVEFAPDSPLEGAGFEPSVPAKLSSVHPRARRDPRRHREARHADRLRRRARRAICGGKFPQ